MKRILLLVLAFIYIAFHGRPNKIQIGRDLVTLREIADVLEGIFPLAPNLSGAEVKAFLIALSHLPGAVELTANLPKSGDTP